MPPVTPYARDDILIDTFKTDKTARMICRPVSEPVLVIGRAGRIEEEVRVDAVVQDGVRVARRKGGGCTVFLDPGNLVVSVVFPSAGYLNIQPLFKKSVQWLINGLIRSGIKGVYPDGISDIVLNNKKVGGTCFYRAKGLSYFSASLLVSAELEKIERYLHHPPREPLYRKGRLHLDFLTNLNDCFNGLTVNRLSQALIRHLDVQVLSDE
ncbi:MAG: hypothetical protein MI862_23310 [Desulfobacterales bacterium]|nr:hypothetical protein [Desulfobacterales bacterium]